MSDPDPDPDPTGMPDREDPGTRADALRAGRLVDAGAMATEAGFCLPVALTSAAWSDCVQWSLEDSSRQLIQHVRHRLWTVLQMASSAYYMTTNPAADILFPVFRVPRDGLSIECQEVVLKAIIESDDGEPVVTISMQHERR